MGWGTKVCSNGPGQMTKMTAMPIYGKKKRNIYIYIYKIFSRTKRPIDNPGLTLACFTFILLIELLCQTKTFMQFERPNRLSEHLHETDCK